MKQKNNSTIKASDVAQWMFNQINKKRELYHIEVVY